MSDDFYDDWPPSPMDLPFDDLLVDEPDWKWKKISDVQYPLDVEVTKQRIWDNIAQIFDPEIPIDIVNVGLIYKVNAEENGSAHVVMTLTSPNCPTAEALPAMVRKGVMQVPGIIMCNLELTFEPSWNPSMMSDDARLSLGID